MAGKKEEIPEIEKPKVKLDSLKKFFSSQNLKRPLTTCQSIIGQVIATIIVGSMVILVIGLKNRAISPEFTLPKIVQPKLSLTLESPASGDIVLDDLVLVKGKTLPQTTVVFYTETDENSMESDSQGNFEGTLTLEIGINTLTVTAFAENGEEKTITLDLVYDEESVKGVKTDKIPPGQAKKVTPPGKAVIGNVDDVTDDSLVVTGKGKGKVKTKVDKDTKIIGQDKKLLRLNSLQPDDLAAVIATDSGEATDSAQPKAHKIYVKKAAQVQQSKRRAVHGVITSLGEPLITLVHQIHRERTYILTTNEATVIKVKGVTDATFADLVVGQRIAAVGDLDETGTLVAKRIHVIPGKATGIFKKAPLEIPEEATPSPEATTSPTLAPSPTATPSSPTVTPTVLLTPTPTPALPTATPTL